MNLELETVVKREARIENGKLQVYAMPELIEILTRKFGETNLQLSISKLYKNRSIEHNAYYWAIITIPANQMGVTPLEMHEITKVVVNPQMHVLSEKTGLCCTIGGGTRYDNSVEFWEFVEKARTMWLLEMGCPTPDPKKQLKIL